MTAKARGVQRPARGRLATMVYGDGYRDSRDLIELIRASVLFFFLFRVVLLFVGVGWFSGPALSLLKVLCYPAAIVCGVLLRSMLTRIAEAVMGTVFATRGGDPYTYQYSLEEAHVVAGRIPQAIDAYHARVLSTPADMEARLRLAALYAAHGPREDAVHWYRQVREETADVAQRLAATNGLIDMHRAAGDRTGLKVELAHYARLRQGTRDGDDAAAERRRLVQEDRHSE